MAFTQDTWKSRQPEPAQLEVNLPLEILYDVIEISDIPTLKSWTTVCRTLFPAARYHLFNRAVLCLRSLSHATNFVQWSSTPNSHTEALLATRFCKNLRLCCSQEETECWFPDILQKLDNKLENIYTLMLDFTSIGVDDRIFAVLTRLPHASDRCLGITPLPNLRNLELVGTNSTFIYRVLEVVSLFPRLETLKTKKFRWNYTDRQYWIPFPALLRHIDAEIEGISYPATFLLAFFAQCEVRQEVSSFFMRIESRHFKSVLDLPEDDILQSQHRHYFFHTLNSLNRLIPDIEHIKLEIPINDVNNEAETRAFLAEQRILRNLRSLSVNGKQVIED